MSVLSEATGTPSQSSKKPDSVGALLLIVVGSIFLLHNFNLLPPDFWTYLWHFWPLILILLGLQNLFGYHWIGRVVLGVVAMGFLYIILAWSLRWPLPPTLDRLKDTFSPSSNSWQPRSLRGTPFYYYQR